MPYDNKQLSITHSVPGTTARINIFSLEAMDIAPRMADRTGGEYNLSDIKDGPSEKMVYITFPTKAALEIFKALCY